jgi:non-ribosomal peptide synthetase-like protein
MSGAGALAGTPLASLYYRLMGAKVGRNCLLDTMLCGSFDLVSIGEGTSIGAETQLLGYRIEDGELVLGRIEIGSRCFVGIHSALELNSRMRDGARLDDLSLLPEGETMKPGESRRGSPAQPARIDLPGGSDAQTRRRHPVVFGLLHLVGLYAVWTFLGLCGVPGLVALLVPFWFFGAPGLLAAAPVAAPLGVFCLTLGVAAAKVLVIGRMKPGVYRVESGFYLRKWCFDTLLRICRGLLTPVYATLYLPPWLRLLGAKIGARTEVSTVLRISPDLLVAGDESFFADAALIGGMRIYGGRFQIGTNRVGCRTFVGNSAMLPIGAELGNESLLGCMSVPPVGAGCPPDGSKWLGSPSFPLPRLQEFEKFDDRVVYRPTVWLYAQRLVIDALRILIPSFVAVGVFVVSLLYLVGFSRLVAPWALFLITPAFGIGLSIGAGLVVAAIKWVLMGRFRPTVKPLWSMFVWLNELVNGAYESIAAPSLSFLLGTPFFAAYLRLLGCKVGRHAYIGTTLFSEFDLVEIGDYVALNVGATIQTHLFEDRIMKASYLKIGDECTVANMAVILYDTEMKPGSTLGPLSLLMKGETIPPSARCLGIPSRVGSTVEGS